MTSPPVPLHRALFAFGSVSFAYFAYAALFSTFAPLWQQSLGYSTLAIGVLASLQSATRLVGPYLWGWLADHTGQRVALLRLAVGLSLVAALGLLWTPTYGWVASVTIVLFLCTAAVIPVSEAALTQHVSQGGALDAHRYGRVRMWGSIGFALAVTASGFLLQALGIASFPALVLVLLAALLLAAWQLPVTREVVQAAGPNLEAASGVLKVLRQPEVAWFFAGVFFTVLAHTSLYAFFSLYLVSLGYSKGSVGLIWAVAVVVEVAWFWFQGRWVHRLSMHAWLLLAAAVTVLRFAVVALFGATLWVLVLAQCSHAITFAAQHTACTALIGQYFPGRLRGRGQALYAVLGYGATGVIGGVAGGALSEALGFSAVFWAACASAVLATLCCWRAMVSGRWGGAVAARPT